MHYLKLLGAITVGELIARRNDAGDIVRLPDLRSAADQLGRLAAQAVGRDRGERSAIGAEIEALTGDNT